VLELTCWIKFCFHGKIRLLQSKPTRIGFLESIPVGLKKKNQVVGYGKQLK
jgi:hypothetical protein